MSLSVGLLEGVWSLPAEVITLVSIGFGVLAFSPLFLIAGWQDLKHQEIDGIVCLAITVALLLHSLLCWGVIGFAVILVLSSCVFRSKELELFGQADFLVLAHYVSAYAGRDAWLWQFTVASIIWLGTLFVFLVIYKVPGEGKNFFQIKRHDFKAKVMIPVLTSYSWAVAIAAVIRLPLSILFYINS